MNIPKLFLTLLLVLALVGCGGYYPTHPNDPGWGGQQQQQQQSQDENLPPHPNYKDLQMVKDDPELLKNYDETQRKEIEEGLKLQAKLDTALKSGNIAKYKSLLEEMERKYFPKEYTRPSQRQQHPQGVYAPAPMLQACQPGYIMSQLGCVRIPYSYGGHGYPRYREYHFLWRWR